MLILLIGPKGSGKSHIGRLLESRLGVHFFHVEPHWMSYHAACAAANQPVKLAEGIMRIHPVIADALATHEHVCIETTGASAEILDDLLSFKERFGLLLVRVEAPLALCLERIAVRAPSNQIPMQEEEIRQIYALSTSIELTFDIVLENIDLTEEQIVRAFAEVGIGEA